MEEPRQQGQDPSSSASNSAGVGDDSLPDDRKDKTLSPEDERIVSNQSEAQNANVTSSNANTASEQTYVYGGYYNGLVNWGENSNYGHAANMQVMSPVIYNDSSSLMFHPAYGFDPQVAYSPFSPLASPLSPIWIEDQFYSPQQVPLSPSYYPQPVSATGFAASAGGGHEGLGENVFWDPESGYYLHYPVNNSHGFYNGPGQSVSNQSTTVGILGPYEFLSGWSADKEVKHRDRKLVNLISDSHATTIDRNRGPRASKPKGSNAADNASDHNDLYNQPDFITTYEKANFFVIKSFSEDNVHRSIKYGVWASTPHGNLKLDAAYQEAKKDGDTSPVFLFFSVNASGQFCGVAEMIGPIDFENDADYWQLDRWSGQFRVQWHIIKDVPNSRFRHILLENNDHKPVTHSRDTQEVKLEEGIAMLKIFKEHDSGTSILDDFSFYDEREKSFQEQRAKECVSSTKDSVDDASIDQLSDRVADSLQLKNQKEAQ